MNIDKTTEYILEASFKDADDWYVYAKGFDSFEGARRYLRDHPGPENRSRFDWRIVRRDTTDTLEVEL